MDEVRKAAGAIAEHYLKLLVERGEPIKETYWHPVTGTTETNCIMIPVRLLNELGRAIKRDQGKVTLVVAEDKHFP